MVYFYFFLVALNCWSSPLFLWAGALILLLRVSQSIGHEVEGHASQMFWFYPGV